MQDTNLWRDAYYDRILAIRKNTYGAAGVAPHASTERWSYTVPSKAQFLLQLLHAHLRRATGATTAAEALVRILDGPTNIRYAYLTSISNTVGDKERELKPCAILLNAGEAIKALTVDGSTAGTLDLLADAIGVEYAA